MNDRFRSGKRQAGLGLITLIFVGVIIVYGSRFDCGIVEVGKA